MAGVAGPLPVLAALRWYWGQSAIGTGDGLSTALGAGEELGEPAADCDVAGAHPVSASAAIQARRPLKAPR